MYGEGGGAIYIYDEKFTNIFKAGGVCFYENMYIIFIIFVKHFIISLLYTCVIVWNEKKNVRNNIYTWINIKVFECRAFNVNVQVVSFNFIFLEKARSYVVQCTN